jgi:hypothetical protein
MQYQNQAIINLQVVLFILLLLAIIKIFEFIIIIITCLTIDLMH